MKTRHGNKMNKKVTHIERPTIKVNAHWFLNYKECIIEDREVWILPINTKNKYDLVSF